MACRCGLGGGRRRRGGRGAESHRPYPVTPATLPAAPPPAYCAPTRSCQPLNNARSTRPSSARTSRWSWARTGHTGPTSRLFTCLLPTGPTSPCAGNPCRRRGRRRFSESAGRAPGPMRQTLSFPGPCTLAWPTQARVPGCLHLLGAGGVGWGELRECVGGGGGTMGTGERMGRGDRMGRGHPRGLRRACS